ncbi:MAG: 50S ribosomal protein L9 [Rickettsiales bacterium]|nr:50S ribosomal protein L9 [Rickettsiales bacterium]
MKIILTAAVPNLGKVGDVVEVKNGYAKNFLIPTKKAICATSNNSKIFELKRKEFEQANDSELATATKIKDKIFGKDVVILENASDDGRLYGSVNSSVIAAKINEVAKGKSVARVNIFLKKPIKEVGVYQVKLTLHSEVVFEVRLVVARNDSEVVALLKADKKASEKSNIDLEEKKSRKSANKEEASEVVAETAEENAEAKSEKPKKVKKKKAE